MFLRKKNLRLQVKGARQGLMPSVPPTARQVCRLACAASIIAARRPWNRRADVSTLRSPPLFCWLSCFFRCRQETTTARSLPADAFSILKRAGTGRSYWVHSGARARLGPGAGGRPRPAGVVRGTPAQRRTTPISARRASVCRSEQALFKVCLVHFAFCIFVFLEENL